MEGAGDDHSHSHGNATATAPAGTLAGHFHLVIDDYQLGMVSVASGLEIANLTNGTHIVKVTLSAPNHQDYDPPVAASVRFTVVGGATSGDPRLVVHGDHSGGISTATIAVVVGVLAIVGAGLTFALRRRPAH
jgi:hypothetical protein